MKQTLYAITEQHKQIIESIFDADGEITPEMETALTVNREELQVKGRAYLEVIKQTESQTALIDAEIKRLQAMKKRNNNVLDRLKSMLLFAVEEFGDFEVGLNKFSTRKSTSVHVEDINALPTDYKVIKVTESANKTAIKNAIKNGEQIDGCSLVENKHLKID